MFIKHAITFLEKIDSTSLFVNTCPPFITLPPFKKFKRLSKEQLVPLAKYFTKFGHIFKSTSGLIISL